MALVRYDWILALITIAFCGSSFGNGANDVANSYATSVAARTLKLWEVGILACITEFVGAVALGKRVTGTIKNDVIDISRFEGSPGVLMLAMGCAEFGSAFWLLTATRLGFPVSTTQTVVGALVGVGIASQADVMWKWADGSVSQVAASWAVAPCLAAAFSAILFGTLKFAILERKNSFQAAMKAIPIYLAFTGSVLALFITIEAPGAPDLDDLGPGKIVGIVLGAFAGCLLIAYVFFVPYFKRRLVMKDTRVRAWHIPLGPLLLRENPPLYFPGKRDGVVIDYYASTHSASESSIAREKEKEKEKEGHEATAKNGADKNPEGTLTDEATPRVLEEGTATTTGADHVTNSGTKMASVEDLSGTVMGIPAHRGPRERFLKPVSHLPLFHHRRLFGYLKFFFLHGVSKDCVSHSDAMLEAVHLAAKKYDNRVEHLWTYAQVASAIMMSIAHGSNDVANAVGPWSAAYSTYVNSEVSTKSDTPVWILVVAGIMLGAGFWFFGYHIIRSLGNKITQMSPTRGYAAELGAAITVLLASRLGLPVSTTQCLTGAVLGVALMNLDFKAINWKQLLFIFCGWVLTLPSAGLISGLLMVMALNAPHF
ncbi:PiT family inorganic phosphate transporter [Zalerion maritima]|uniref:Phosphate transporter n=1 Tax=Zalerion maritima TaxID=339359 RepID=A0AAD5RVH0_9PEZI|nr:PiT family inorganic phosphate transporter [Zalerion maritima]